MHLNLAIGMRFVFNYRCCYGTAIESFSKLADSIYFKQRSNVTSTTDSGSAAVVQSQVPSTVLLTRFADSVLQPTADTVGMSQIVRVTPTSLQSQITIRQSATAVANQRSIKVLVPSWTKDTYAAITPLAIVNGKPLESPPPIPGDFLTVAPPRPSGWQTGDTIRMELPCPLKLRRLDDNRTAYGSMYSFVAGDTLLVGLERAPGAPNRIIVPHLTNLSWVTISNSSSARKPLRFVANVRGRGGDDKLELMPLNEVVHERYTVYYNISVVAAD